MPKKQKRHLKSPSSSQKILDILVPFYGEYRLMSEAMAAIPEAVGDLSVRTIVVDNGTNDGKSNNFLKSIGVKEIFTIRKNVGYPGAINRGAKRGTSPLIMVLTADVVMDPGSIEKMVNALDDPEIGVVGCKLIFPEDGSSPHGPAGTIQHAGIAVNIGARVFHIHMGWPADSSKPNMSKKMQAVTGAAIMFRRNLFKTLKGFNEDYGQGTFEDIEFCFGVRHLGKKVLYLAEAQGSHYVGGSIKEGNQKEGFDLLTNEQKFSAKFRQGLEWDEWRYW